MGEAVALQKDPNLITQPRRVVISRRGIFLARHLLTRPVRKSLTIKDLRRRACAWLKSLTISNLRFQHAVLWERIVPSVSIK